MQLRAGEAADSGWQPVYERLALDWICLLYTSDAADERSSVDLGGRRIIKKKNTTYIDRLCIIKDNVTAQPTAER